jgi:preprotein translocase subunit SecY
MKKLIDTLKNIWAIDELKSKILVTLALVLTYRIGAQITLPGINPLAIETASKSR